MLSAVLWCALSVHPAPVAVVEGPGDLLVRTGVDGESIFVAPLESLAKWCQGERLYGRRDWVYEQLLLVDPDHRTARKYLKYKRVSGEWVQSDRYRPRTDRNESALQAFEGKLAEVASGLRIQLGKETDAAEDPEAGDQLWQSFLLLFPDDEAAHAMLGRVPWTSSRGEELWVGDASFMAWERRTDLSKTCREALARKGLAHPEMTPSNRPLTQEDLDTHAEDCVNLVQAAQQLFSAALPGGARVPEGMQVIALYGEGAREEYLDSLEGLSEEDRPDHERISSWWVPNTAILLLWDDSLKLHRRDAVIQSVVAMFQYTYKVDPESGWLAEGMACYASEEILGRPYSFHLPHREESTEEAPRHALPSGIRLREELDRVLEELTPAKLQATWSRGGTELSRDEMLLSACFARYLVEARPDTLIRVIRSVARGESATESILEVMGRSPEELIEDVRGWHHDMARMALAERAPQH